MGTVLGNVWVTNESFIRRDRTVDGAIGVYPLLNMTLPDQKIEFTLSDSTGKELADVRFKHSIDGKREVEFLKGSEIEPEAIGFNLGKPFFRVAIPKIEHNGLHLHLALKFSK